MRNRGQKHAKQKYTERIQLLKKREEKTFNFENEDNSKNAYEAGSQVHTLIWDITPLFEDLRPHMSQSVAT